MDSFKEYMWYLLSSPFKLVEKKINQWWIFISVIGKWFDTIKNEFQDARDETTIATCSDIMLQYHGEERGLTQYTGESKDTYRERIALYDEMQSLGGTKQGILLALAAIGYEDVEYIWYPQLGENERWAEFLLVLSVDIETAVNKDFLRSTVRTWKESDSKDNYCMKYLSKIKQETEEQAEVEEIKESYFYGYRKFDGRERFDGTHTFDECVATYSYEIS